MTTIRDLLNYLQHQLSETAVSSLSDIDLGNLENELDHWKQVVSQEHATRWLQATGGVDIYD